MQSEMKVQILSVKLNHNSEVAPSVRMLAGGHR